MNLPTTPQAPMGPIRALLILSWFVALPAAPIWIGLHHGWPFGAAIGAWVFFTAVFWWDLAFWDLRSDGYRLDKVVGTNGRRRWRIRSADERAEQVTKPNWKH